MASINSLNPLASALMQSNREGAAGFNYDTVPPLTRRSNGPLGNYWSDPNVLNIFPPPQALLILVL